MNAATSRARLVIVAAVAASALAFALYARAESPWHLLGWILLVPWLIALDRAATLPGALVVGLLMSEAFVAAVFGWLPSAIRDYTGASWTVAALSVLLLAPLLEPQFITFAAVRHVTRRRTAMSSRSLGAGFWHTTLAGACAYVGTEWAFPKLFADTLGQGLYPSARLRQAVDLAGAFGLTLVLIVANECVLATARALKSKAPPNRLRRALAPAACVTFLAAALLVYGAIRLQQFERPGRSANIVTAGVVQADITHYNRLAAELGTFDALRMILDTHVALSTEVLGRSALDLLVWPETVYPTTFGSPKSEDGAAFDRELGAFVTRTGVPLVFGAYDTDGEDEFNAAVFLEPAADGGLTFDTYRKASLFPLTERVPAVFESALVRRWLPWLGTWKPGRGPQAVSITLRDGQTLRVAPLICYDALSPSLAIAAVRQGAEVLLTLSNDSWFAYDNVPRLILVISALRSIETRRPQVRATNTGISAVITATGELVDTMGVDQRGTMVAATNPERHATTLMLAWGDWFGPTALVAGIALLAAGLLRPSAR